jgi:hypothetical protein
MRLVERREKGDPGPFHEKNSFDGYLILYEDTLPPREAAIRDAKASFDKRREGLLRAFSVFKMKTCLTD